eukprot:jgi/Ulvmu1/8212/UM041_0021.1
MAWLVQATIVRVAHGSVSPVGLAALLHAIQKAGSACSAGGTALRSGSGPQGIDLWNAGVAKPRAFMYLIKSINDGELDRLRLIRLCDLGLSDDQISQLSSAIGRHPSLEMLSVASNAFTATSGLLLFGTFVSLQNAQVLDVSCNPLGDTMAQGIADRLSSGTPWKLRTLLFAYCSVTRAGLVETSRIVRAGADNLEHLVISGQQDKHEVWETLVVACLDNTVKLRVLPDLVDSAKMTTHVMEAMSLAAVSCKSTDESLAASFMSYFDQFMKSREGQLGHIHALTEPPIVDEAWDVAMQVMDTIRHPCTNGTDP